MFVITKPNLYGNVPDFQSQVEQNLRLSRAGTLLPLYKMARLTVESGEMTRDREIIIERMLNSDAS